jgi:hypothetical protein
MPSQHRTTVITYCILALTGAGSVALPENLSEPLPPLEPAIPIATVCERAVPAPAAIAAAEPEAVRLACPDYVNSAPDLLATD